MEKDVKDILGLVEEEFDVENKDIRTYSPLTLAYIGDSIYDLVIRTVLVIQGNKQPNKLHREASQLVMAKAQSDLMQCIYPELTEEEIGVYKRGRNAKSQTMAKNATMGDYRRATGFEALMGYLYLTKQMPRIVWLVKRGLEELWNDK